MSSPQLLRKAPLRSIDPHLFFVGWLRSTRQIPCRKKAVQKIREPPKEKQAAEPGSQTGIVPKCKSARLAGLPPSLRYGAPLAIPSGEVRELAAT
jgi:hypothetical protein